MENFGKIQLFRSRLFFLGQALISQSCDIAHHSEDTEPFIELAVCQIIDQHHPMKINGRNPRSLHTHLFKNDGTGATKEVKICLSSHHKFIIQKAELVSHTPDETYTIDFLQLDIVTRWLSERYKRPAFPTKFNDRMKPYLKKLNNLYKGVNDIVTGLYINIFPNTEHYTNDIYNVNLLALTRSDYDGELTTVVNLINGIKTHMESNMMVVNVDFSSESDTSVATIRDMDLYSA